MTQTPNKQPSVANEGGMFSHFREDFLASIVVFLVALPLCIGIAVAVGVSPARALLTGIIGGIVVGLIGSTGMTGHFQKVANREWWSAEILRALSVILPEPSIFCSTRTSARSTARSFSRLLDKHSFRSASALPT